MKKFISIKKCVAIILALILFVGIMPITVLAGQSDDIVAIATAETGSTNVSKYTFGAGNVAWCAYFVSWCARQAGIATNVIPTNGNCDSLYSGLINSCSASVVTSPQKGDLLFYKSHTAGETFQHVGIMISSTLSVQGNLNGTVINNLKPTDYWYSSSGPAATASDIVYVRPQYVGSTPTSGLPGAMTASSDSTFNTGEDVILSWTTAANAVKYGLTVRNTANGSTVFDNYVYGNQEDIGKLPIGNYKFDMAAYNSAGTMGPVSNMVYFSVLPLPGTPTLCVAATNKSTEPVSFSWAATSDTTNYDLWILQNGSVINTIYSIANTNYSIQLAADSYSAYLCSVNTNYTNWWTVGNTVNFDVVSPPIITINPYTTTPTNQNITVIASTNEGTLNATSHTFTANGSYTFTATDAVGNSTSRTVTITNIDKMPPIVSGVSNNAFYNVNKKITFNEGTAALNGKSFNSGSTVSSEGKYTLIVNDKAGNKTTVVFTIDKTVPKITVKTLSSKAITSGSSSKGGATFSYSETNFLSKTITINGKGISWPTSNKVTTKGTYVISVSDKAGNKSSFTFKVV